MSFTRLCGGECHMLTGASVPPATRDGEHFDIFRRHLSIRTMSLANTTLSQFDKMQPLEMATTAEGKPEAVAEDPVSFLTLPNELLSEVTKHLEPSDLLKLRLILPKNHHQLLLSLLQHILKRLYLMPARKSLTRFTEICKVPFFREHVTEAVFLPQVLLDDPDRPTSLLQYAEECASSKADCLVTEDLGRAFHSTEAGISTKAWSTSMVAYVDSTTKKEE